MKKRCLLGLLGICLVMILTGCEALGALGAKEPTLEGEWVAEWDLSDQIVEEMGSEMAVYAEYFDDIVLVVNFEFTDDEVEMSIDEDSVDDMIEKITEGMIKLFDAFMEDMANEAGMSVDDIYTLMGYTRDQYLELFMEEIDLDTIIDGMTEDLDASGKYEYDEDDENIIIVTYEDEDEEEEWKVELDGDELTITIETDEMDIEFECERK